MSDAPPNEIEIAGVTVRKDRRRSGPVWKWRTNGNHDVIVHSEIMWVEETRKWLRGTSITDDIAEGGWQHYPVHYDRAYDEQEAWSVVFRVVTRELEGVEREWA